MGRLMMTATALVLGSIIAVGAYKLGHGGSSRPDGQVGATASAGGGDPSDGNAKLAASLQQIDRRLAALEIKQTMATLDKAAEAQTAGGGAAPPIGSRGGPIDMEALKEKASQRAAAIDAALKTEARDGAWATTTEKQMQSAVAAVAKDGTQVSLRAIRCLTSVCEMVLTAASPDQLTGAPNQLITRIENMGSIDIAPLETAADGTAMVTLRLFRSGYPRPDQGVGT